jgi:hypothetical protein
MQKTYTALYMKMGQRFDRSLLVLLDEVKMM